MNSNVEQLMKYLQIAEDIGCDKVVIRHADLVLLNSILEAHEEKERKMKDLIINLSNELKELEL